MSLCRCSIHFSIRSSRTHLFDLFRGCMGLMTIVRMSLVNWKFRTCDRQIHLMAQSIPGYLRQLITLRHLLGSPHIHGCSYSLHYRVYLNKVSLQRLIGIRLSLSLRIDSRKTDLYPHKITQLPNTTNRDTFSGGSSIPQ